MIVRLLNTPGLYSPQAYINATPYTMTHDDAKGDWYAYVGFDVFYGIGDYPLQVWDGDTLISSGQVSVANGGFTYESFEVPPSSSDLLVDQARIDSERAQIAQIESVFTPQKYWSGPWIIPTQAGTSSEFGAMRSENGGPYIPHLGVDLANDEGTPIYAAADGVIAYASQLYLYGNSVIIDHGVGVFSDYSHMQSMVVTAGQTVHQGELIGYMGQTGYVTGPHLHWEAIVHGVRVDPRLFTLAGSEP
jgi:murein DD-endopeptidase MepM/ murein hydrolase activator NlpD